MLYEQQTLKMSRLLCIFLVFVFVKFVIGVKGDTNTNNAYTAADQYANTTTASVVNISDNAKRIEATTVEATTIEAKTGITETTDNIPVTTTNITETIDNIIENITEITDITVTTTNITETTDNITETTGNITETTDNITETTDNITETTDNIPVTTTNITETIDDITENITEITDITFTTTIITDTTDNITETADNITKTTNDIINTSDTTIEATTIETTTIEASTNNSTETLLITTDNITKTTDYITTTDNIIKTTDNINENTDNITETTDNITVTTTNNTETTDNITETTNYITKTSDSVTETSTNTSSYTTDNTTEITDNTTESTTTNQPDQDGLEVRNLTIIPKAHSFNVSWNKPICLENKECTLLKYIIEMSWTSNHYIPEHCNKSSNTYRVSVSKESFEYLDSRPDYHYNVTVYAVFTRKEKGPKTTRETNTLSALPEICTNLLCQVQYKENNITLKSINCQWNNPCERNGKIKEFKICATWQYSEDETIQKSQNFSIEDNFNGIIIDYSFPKSFFQYSAYYTFQVQAINSDGEGELSEPSNLTTRTNYPGEPRNVTFDSNSNLITWEAPKENYGKLDYKINIKSNGTKHGPDGENCSSKNNTNIDGTTLETKWLFDLWHYDSDYTISITARTSAGLGKANVITVSTDDGTPEAPRNLTIKICENEITQDTYNVSYELDWQPPCYPYGEIDHYKIDVITSYSEKKTYNVTTLSFKTENVHAYTEYSFNIFAVLENGNIGEKATKTITTPEGYLKKPENLIIYEVNKNISIRWDAPRIKMGQIKAYELTYKYKPAQGARDCSPNSYSETIITQGTEFNLTLYPYYEYEVNVSSLSKIAGYNSSSENKRNKSRIQEPDGIKILNISVDFDIRNYTTYYGKAQLQLEPPCKTNGPEGYFLDIKETRNGKLTNMVTTRFHFNNITSIENFIEIKPRHKYDVNLIVSNGEFNTSVKSPFNSCDGVPVFDKTKTLYKKSEIGTRSAVYFIENDYYNDDNGDIVKLGVILSNDSIKSATKAGKIEESWPLPENEHYIQIWENPFEKNEELKLIIGNGRCEIDGNDTHGLNCSNNELEPDTEYYMVIRAFTKDAYVDSDIINIETSRLTDAAMNVALITILVFSLCTLSIISIFLITLWKKGKRNNGKRYRNETQMNFFTKLEVLDPEDISVESFLDHWKRINASKELSFEYDLLTKRTKDIRISCEIAKQEENRSKNRYTNILPYDSTRVKLEDDEDKGSTESLKKIDRSYINASHIKGISEVDYIATQGPLPKTFSDFWKMIIQQNVTVIIMVTQFNENSKIKCSKYYPENIHEMMEEDNIRIKCICKVPFKTYCKRTLQIKRINNGEEHQCTVTHMQFLDWPDFGIPDSPDTMLEFLSESRAVINENIPQKMAVHCSAGVGRTGTFIAIDMLIQQVNRGEDINVFKTILDLRHQRPHMVQAEKQYKFIYQCVADHIRRPHTSNVSVKEPIYVNLNP